MHEEALPSTNSPVYDTYVTIGEERKGRLSIVFRNSRYRATVNGRTRLQYVVMEVSNVLPRQRSDVDPEPKFSRLTLNHQLCDAHRSGDLIFAA
jgi:hypothetical protein